MSLSWDEDLDLDVDLVLVEKDESRLVDDILEYCSETPRHFNEIYDYLRSKNYTISRRRLVKILLSLVREGRLRELQCRFFYTDTAPMSLINERLMELGVKCYRRFSDTENI